MIRLRYMNPNGDAIETGEIVKDVGIELQIFKTISIILYYTI